MEKRNCSGGVGKGGGILASEKQTLYSNFMNFNQVPRPQERENGEEGRGGHNKGMGRIIKMKEIWKEERFEYMKLKLCKPDVVVPTNERQDEKLKFCSYANQIFKLRKGEFKEFFLAHNFYSHKYKSYILKVIFVLLYLVLEWLYYSKFNFYYETFN